MKDTKMTVYTFGNGAAEGSADMKDVLGGKGANLAAMAKLGLPIPAGLTIPTTYCSQYQSSSEMDREALTWALAVHSIAKLTQLFPAGMPLLSVRSGARVSMPGMMDTILNVGLCSDTIEHWKGKIGERAALDSYRRLIQMYASTVDGLPHEHFENLLMQARAKAKVETDAELNVTQLEALVEEYLTYYNSTMGKGFPDTLEAQLQGCIGAVFGSWMNERAVEYRIANKIPHEWGTAVTVQQMVFGNAGDDSATGVLFTRNPNSGEPGLYGEFLVNAQGEDVVAGIRTPEPIAKMKEWNSSAYDELEHWAFFMEAEHRDMQDMEFTVEQGTLFLLQTRSGKRSARAAFRVAKDMVDDQVITLQEAIRRVNGKQVMALKRPTIPADYAKAPKIVGLPAAGSVVKGVAVFSAEKAKNSKEPCILVAEETTPDDFGGMMASVGILTRTGGATSHAAVVARGMDKCCVVGASDLKIGQTIKEGDHVTMDGSTGRVWVNEDVPVQAGGLTPEAAWLVNQAKAMKMTAEVAQRIELDETLSNLATVPDSGVVVLGVSRAFAGKNGPGNLSDLLKDLNTRKHLTGVIDFEPEAGGEFPQDREVMIMLGAAGATVPTTIMARGDKVRARMLAKQWTKTLLTRWAVNVADEAFQGELVERGWAVVRSAPTLGDLLAGTCMVKATPDLLQRLAAENLNLSAIIALMDKAGTPLKLAPATVDEDTLMFELLGE